MHAGPVYHSCFFEGPLYHSSTWAFSEKCLVFTETLTDAAIEI